MLYVWAYTPPWREGREMTVNNALTLNDLLIDTTGAQAGMTVVVVVG
jgi:hypothetical protein